MLKTATKLLVLPAVAIGGLLLAPAEARAGHDAERIAKEIIVNVFGNRGHQRHDHDHDHDHARDRDRDNHNRGHTRRIWVPGHYEYRDHTVMVRAGYYKKVFHPAQYRHYRDRYGREHCVLVHAAHYDNVWVPPVYDTHKDRVWVEGYWKTVTDHHHRRF